VDEAALNRAHLPDQRASSCATIPKAYTRNLVDEAGRFCRRRVEDADVEDREALPVSTAAPLTDCPPFGEWARFRLRRPPRGSW
jgi:hypothetical protein